MIIKNIFNFILIIFLMTSISSATSYLNITDTMSINLDNGAYINLTAPQNFSNTTDPIIIVYNSTDSLKSTLEINFNATKAQWNNTVNTTLSNIRYTTNNLYFTATSTSGILNISQKTNQSNTDFDFFVDINLNTTTISNVSGWVFLNYSNWTTTQHDFLITSLNPQISSSSVSSSSIFKCQPSTINLILNDSGAISVNAIVYSQTAVNPMVPGSGRIIPETQTTIIPMSSTDGGTTWTGTFGNNNTLLWGNRLISFNVTYDSIYIISSPLSIFVYSDACTGTGLTNYTQVLTPIGNKTRVLMTSDINILEWAIYPYVMYWGYLFYMLVIGTIVAVIYLKTQNVVQPLVIGLVLLLVMAGTTVVPETWRNGIVFLIALVLSVIYYRVFTREQ